MANKPQDRYPTPQALASDIEHWLADEPVAAWREPLAVRTRRWARRHRTLVTSAAALFLASVIAGSLGFVALSREQAATETARAEAVAAAQTATAQTETTQAVSGFLKGMFEEPTPYAFFGIQIGARDIDPAAEALLDRAAQRLLSGQLDDQPEIKTAMLATIGKAYFGVGMVEKGTPLIEETLANSRRQRPIDPEELTGLFDVLAQARFVQGRSIEAEELALESLRLAMSYHRAGNAVLTDAKTRLAVVYSMTARHSDETDRLWHEVIAERKRALAPNDPLIAEALIGLAGNSMWPWRKKAAIAMPLILEAKGVLAANPATKELGDAIGNTIQAEILGLTLSKGSAAKRGKLAWEQFRGLLGENHPITVFIAAEYANRLLEDQQFDDAIDVYDQVLELFAERGLRFLQPAQERMILRGYAMVLERTGVTRPFEASLRAISKRQRELVGYHSDSGHAVIARLLTLLHARGAVDEARAIAKEHVAGICAPGVTISSRYLVPLVEALDELEYWDEERAVLEKNIAMAREQVAAGPAILPAVAIGRRLDLALELDSLGRYFVAQSRPAEAVAPYREALGLRRETLGPDHADVARNLEALAECLREPRQSDESDRLRAQAVAMRRRLEEKSTPDRATAASQRSEDTAPKPSGTP